MKKVLTGMGIVVTAVSLIASVSTAGLRIPHVHAQSFPAHAEIDPALVLASKNSPVFERLGLAQSGPAVTYRAGDTRARLLGGVGGEMFGTGVQAAEPTLGVNSKGYVFYKGLDTHTPTGLRWPVVASFDSGKTWEDVSSKIGERYVHDYGQDPFLYLDKATGRIFDNDWAPGCTILSYSDDVQEQGWTHSGICSLSDHQNIFAGPPATSTTINYPNVLYYCAIDGGALAAFGTLTSCVKSIDGGDSWVRTGAPAFNYTPTAGEGMFGVPGHCGGATGHGFTDSKGTVYLPRGYCGQAWLAVSEDEGQTWTRMQVANNGFPATSDGQLQEHEAAVAVDKAGTIYYFYMARNRLPYLVTSDDGGASWAKPIRVGAPGITEAALPVIDVGDDGSIAMAYVGSTNAPGGVSPEGFGARYTPEVSWNGYITVSTNADRNKPRFFTAMVNDPKDPLLVGECGVVRCGAEYDFIDVVIGPDGTPWAAYVDACDQNGVCVPIGAGVVGHMVGGPNLGRW